MYVKNFLTSSLPSTSWHVCMVRKLSMTLSYWLKLLVQFPPTLCYLGIEVSGGLSDYYISSQHVCGALFWGAKLSVHTVMA